ncbi:hypothetical protein [Streptomyces xiamenensis]
MPAGAAQYPRCTTKHSDPPVSALATSSMRNDGVLVRGRSVRTSL